MDSYDTSWNDSSELLSAAFAVDTLYSAYLPGNNDADHLSSEINDGTNTYSGNISSSSLPFNTGGHDVLVQENILRDIITDEQYQALRKLGLLNEKVLRDVHIRKTFRELRAQHLSAHQAIERLQALYPYLQFDTLRKIVYQINEKI